MFSTLSHLPTTEWPYLQALVRLALALALALGLLIGLERERWLSSAFIRGQDYGTRASTVVAIGHDGHGVIIERRWGPMGVALGQTRLPIGRL